MKACKDCGSTTRKLNYQGPRCKTCWLAFKTAAKRRTLDRYYRKTYKMSLEEYEALYAFQGGKCWVCQWATGSTKRLAVDHDHECCPTTPTCGQCTRGLVCSNDNKMFGRAKDDTAFFHRAAEYLTYPPYQRMKDHKRGNNSND